MSLVSDDSALSYSMLPTTAASERNKGPIMDAMESLNLFSDANKHYHVLEIACGLGAHVVSFATKWPHVKFSPTDYDITNAKQTNMRVEQYRIHQSLPLANVNPAIQLDCSLEPNKWNLSVDEKYTHSICVNLCHISPWEATVGLFKGLSSYLQPGGICMIYGPFNLNGEFTSQGNRDFDGSLRRQNPLWGIRDVSEMENVAKLSGFSLQHRLDMPSNNMFLVFQKK